jgi:hypothetical protein
VPIRRPRFAPAPPARGPRARLDALMRELGAKQDTDPVEATGPEAADAPRARQAHRVAPKPPKTD